MAQLPQPQVSQIPQHLYKHIAEPEIDHIWPQLEQTTCNMHQMLTSRLRASAEQGIVLQGSPARQSYTLIIAIM